MASATFRLTPSCRCSYGVSRRWRPTRSGLSTRIVTKIADYKDILGRRERVFGIIQDELNQLSERYTTRDAQRFSIWVVGLRTSI